MAALSLPSGFNSSTSLYAGDTGVSLSDARHYVVPFQGSDTVDSADTMAASLFGPNAVFVGAAWESDSDEGYINVAANPATAVFIMASAGSNGWAHFWVKG